MAWRTSNGTLATQITQQGAADFKAVNNLLTLQENHVEEFFQYHGVGFLTAFEQLMEDVTERVVSKMLVKLKFVNNTNGDLEIEQNALREFETISAANIELDIQSIVAAALNTEVIMQRKMAKQQYLEAQGFSTAQAPSTGMPQSMPSMPQAPMAGMPPMAGGLQPSQISGGNPMVQANNMIQQQGQAMNNPSGYPVPPQGYDTMGNPYWIDPATGQPSYSPPGSGLGLGKMIQKGAAWAAWLA